MTTPRKGDLVCKRQQMMSVLRLMTSIVFFVVSFCSQAWAQPYKIPSPIRFTDRELLRILNYSQMYGSAGLLYAWSPRMNLSVLGAYQIQLLAAEMGLELTLLVDPQATESEIAKAVFEFKILNVYQIHSVTLQKLGVFLHYPSLIIYKKGKLKGSVRPGYDDPERLRKYLRTVLAQGTAPNLKRSLQ